MVTVAIYIWLIGLLVLLLGFVLTTTDIEMRRTTPVGVVLAYIFWPITLIAIIFHVLRGSRGKR
jgi:hypothetical protein